MLVFISINCYSLRDIACWMVFIPFCRWWESFWRGDCPQVQDYIVVDLEHQSQGEPSALWLQSHVLSWFPLRLCATCAPRTHPPSFPSIMKAEPLFFQRSSSDPSSFGSWTPWCPENSILCGPRFVSSSCPTTLRTAVQTQCQHRCPFFLGGLSRGWCAGDGRGGGLGLCWPCLHSACPQPPKAMLS